MDKAEPLFSTVTVCFNAEATIERTIQSVLSQTWKDREYLIVDGGSTDGTLDIVRKYEKEGLRWISEPDGGIYDAMNKGVRLAQGHWIHLLNADDVYSASGILEKVIPSLQEGHTNYCDILIQNQKGVRWRQDFPFNRWKLNYSAYLPHPGLVVHRDQYDDIGSYDDRLRIAADHDFILRMLNRYPAHRIAEPLTLMYQGGASSQSAEKTFREFMQVSIAHGTPRPLAFAFFWVKFLRWQWKGRS